jgi:hypothetical protein
MILRIPQCFKVLHLPLVLLGIVHHYLYLQQKTEFYNLAKRNLSQVWNVADPHPDWVQRGLYRAKREKIIFTC